ncbi:amidohydrolase family protein [Nonomuraea sp. NBC_01738]|uniref:amidohydrolase family protein n=1 Tax=Nonomuraea sp. NBC_01738 TaxID=2976003 RepID=UPI002E129CD9|nr:amidohydrolase family protein [Nonomuraea sp. NBC_01738]
MGPVVHSATVVLTMDGPPIPGGNVTVEDGRVVAIGAGRGEVHWDGVLVAGLVNAHTHLQYTCMAEVGQRVYDSFEHWSEVFNRAYFKGGEGTWDPAERAGAWDWRAGALDGAWQCLRSGTTSAADIVTDPEAFVDTPLGGLPYLEIIGDTDASWIADGRERFLATLGGRNAGISPHSPYTLDTGVLADSAVLARERGTRLHIHLAESAHEREYTISGTGPLAELVSAWCAPFALLRDGGSGLAPAAYLDSLGLLGPDCHLAHGIYLGADDRALLRERGTTIALCPRSNRVLGLDGPDVAALLAEGNPIAVGTDSLSSSPSLDLLADVAALKELAVRQGHRDPDLDRVLIEAATLGGARALGMEGEIGVLRPGARADFALFDVDPREPYRSLAENGAGRCVATVVGGKIIWAL